MSKASDSILNFLKNNPRYSYNAPSLFNHFKGKIPINTIRSELRRLNENKKIIRISHGFYKINVSPDVLHFVEQPSTLLHGIMVSMDSIRIRKLQNCIDGISPDNCIWDDLERFNFELRANNKYIKKFYYQDDSDRLVTITVHGGVGRIDTYLNCSNHPVNYFEFREILSYCKANFDCLRPFVNERVVQFGMAKDFREVRMEGVSSLTLRAFNDCWFRVYNKEKISSCRVEQHLRCNVSVDTFVSMFERMFLPVGDGVVGNGHRVDTLEDVA